MASHDNVLAGQQYTGAKGSAQIGICVEPIMNVEGRVAASGTAVSNQVWLLVFVALDFSVFRQTLKNSRKRQLETWLIMQNLLFVKFQIRRIQIALGTLYPLIQLKDGTLDLNGNYKLILISGEILGMINLNTVMIGSFCCC